MSFIGSEEGSSTGRASEHTVVRRWLDRRWLGMYVGGLKRRKSGVSRYKGDLVVGRRFIRREAGRRSRVGLVVCLSLARRQL